MNDNILMNQMFFFSTILDLNAIDILDRKLQASLKFKSISFFYNRDFFDHDSFYYKISVCSVFDLGYLHNICFSRICKVDIIHPLTFFVDENTELIFQLYIWNISFYH